MVLQLLRVLSQHLIDHLPVPRELKRRGEPDILNGKGILDGKYE